jgi:hypothetical protein
VLCAGIAVQGGFPDAGEAVEELSDETEEVRDCGRTNP